MEVIRETHSVDEVVYSPFSVGRKVYFVESRYVTAATIDETGKNRIHLIYGPGSYFPVLSVYRNTEQRATYRTLTNVQLTSMDSKVFLHRLDIDQKFCREILQKTVDQMALFADRVMDLQLTKLSDRLLLKLQVLARDHGQKVGVNRRLPYRLRHQQIADLLGVERESVSRSLKQLQLQGDISVTTSGHFLVHP